MNNAIPAPFFKWAGGKRHLVDYVLPALGDLPGHRYVEPFVGGGAIFFAVRAAGFAGPGVINDLCLPVAAVYRCVAAAPDRVLAAFAQYAAQDSREFYYSVRQAPPDRTADPYGYAAWFLYLNKAGFNGLWRENAKGLNNVPYGDGKPPTMNEAAVYAASAALRNTETARGDFAKIGVCAGDVVYCDPPYLPLTKTASFTTYTAGGFGGPDQLRLAAWARRTADDGARVVISNAGHPDSVAAFRAVADRVIDVPSAPRVISCKGSKRVPVAEYIFVLEAK